jgi:N-methylhydantoinase A/oxoprolinase/acetone carboxylase beta subunit
MIKRESRRLKIGIDVGGTFTHAVAVDIVTMALVGKAVVPTTHAAKEGVARGVVESMQKLLETAAIRPEEILLIAHSTTQATNALLEGDVAKVGIVAMGQGAQGLRAKSEANVQDIELAKGKFLRTAFRYVDLSEGFDDERIRVALQELREESAEVIVASESFGVDDPTREQRVVALANEMGLPATAGSELSQLYGLRIRTRTAVINASMLPKMLETAHQTEQAVRASGIRAPLMVMRSDGGIMDIEAMRRRPILTMLSGPAAGVAAALMYERISDGIFIEVGGTSTDISMIQNGRPIVTFGQVGGHRVYLRTLDVRTVGVAGGSMPRVKKSRLIEVGPRSAHIAGLRYEAFTENIGSVRPTTIRPRPGDPDDYLALAINDETKPTVTLTPTGAANVLNLATGYGKGIEASIRISFEAVAAWLHLKVDALARQLLEIATRKINAVVQEMLAEHKMKEVVLVGGGGGAEAIVPFAAQRLKLEFRIAKNPEVISAIGVALGIIQDTVERMLIDPAEQDLLALRREAFESVQRMGADAGTIEVFIEVDRQSRRVRATAQGTPELRTHALGGKLPTTSEFKAIAARSMRVDLGRINDAIDLGWMQIFQAEQERKRLFGLFTTIRTPVRVLDREGIIRLQLADARIDRVAAGELESKLRKVIEQLTTYGDAGALLPEVFLITSGKIIDLTGLVQASQMLSVGRVETQMLAPKDEVVVISCRK